MSVIAPYAARLAAHDESALDELYQLHATPVFRFACRRLSSTEEAQDLVHDVFLRLWRQRDTLAPGTDVEAYLYVMARNRALDVLRHRQVQDRAHGRQIAPALREMLPQAAPAADEQTMAAERVEAIRQALELLPYRQRAILVLRWRRQLTNDEIATELGISVKTVEMHVTRAIRTLRPILASLRP